jgi:hypothetical protein
MHGPITNADDQTDLKSCASRPRPLGVHPAQSKLPSGKDELFAKDHRKRRSLEEVPSRPGCLVQVESDQSLCITNSVGGVFREIGCRYTEAENLFHQSAKSIFHKSAPRTQEALVCPGTSQGQKIKPTEPRTLLSLIRLAQFVNSILNVWIVMEFNIF